MIRYDRKIWWLAMTLAALAGFIDALGFVALGGFFVSFMTGNTTRAGVGLAHLSLDALLGLGLIAIFVGGVVVGALVAQRSGNRSHVVLLGIIAVLLASGALAHEAGWFAGAVAAMALAMGMENSIFRKNGEVSIALTYMTGTLVRMGQKIAQHIEGGVPNEWVPNLLMWLALMIGAVAGAAIYPFVGLRAIWIAAALAALLAILSSKTEVA